MLKITIGPLSFTARLEEEAAPHTCQAIHKMLPFKERIVQTRWSGEAAWVPMGDFPVGVGYENQTSFPAPGQLLIYTGPASETEIIMAYGACCFSSKVGQLAGNHFATLLTGHDQLKEVGRLVLWEGAQTFTIELVED